ncbi:helix-turn-helix domain-containing protein [Leptospira sp. 96542]|nr:helix-turn-helix domain-containing protein [Leptospira sp. 96542]
MFGKKPKFSFDTIFVSFLLVLAVPHLGHLFFRLGWDGFLHYTRIYPLLFGPILYFYVSDLTEQKIKNLYLHFLPFLFFHLPVFFSFFNFQVGDFFPLKGIVSTSIVFSISVYSFFILKKIKTHNHHLQSNFSKIDSSIDLSWLKVLLWVFISATAFHVIYNIIKFKYINVLHKEIRMIQGVEILTFTFFFAYFGVRQNFIYTVFSKTLGSGGAEPNIRKKYERSGLKPDEIPVIKEKLIRYMQNTNAYQDSEFNLDKLSSETGILKSYITQVLSEGMNTNFYQFVNGFRIRGVVEELAGSTKTNLLQLAFQWGFNSKSTFNDSFKKITGKTPSEFQKQKK